MTAVMDLLGVGLVVAGVLMITLGTIGLIRFPNLLTRLHALTKADNVGLGLCVLGLSLIERDAVAALVMLVVWAFVMLAGATAAQLDSQFRDGFGDFLADVQAVRKLAAEDADVPPVPVHIDDVLAGKGQPFRLSTVG